MNTAPNFAISSEESRQLAEMGPDHLAYEIARIAIAASGVIEQ